MAKNINRSIKGIKNNRNLNQTIKSPIFIAVLRTGLFDSCVFFLKYKITQIKTIRKSIPTNIIYNENIFF